MGDYVVDATEEKTSCYLFLALGSWQFEVQQMLSLMTLTFMGTEVYGGNHMASLDTILHCPMKVSFLEDSKSTLL